MTNAHTVIKNQAKMFIKFAACCAVSRICWNYGFLFSLTGFEDVRVHWNLAHRYAVTSFSFCKKKKQPKTYDLVSRSSILQNPVLFRRCTSA